MQLMGLDNYFIPQKKRQAISMNQGSKLELFDSPPLRPPLHWVGRPFFGGVRRRTYLRMCMPYMRGNPLQDFSGVEEPAPKNSNKQGIMWGSVLSDCWRRLEVRLSTASVLVIPLPSMWANPTAEPSPWLNGQQTLLSAQTSGLCCCLSLYSWRFAKPTHMKLLLFWDAVRARRVRPHQEVARSPWLLEELRWSKLRMLFS